MNTLSDIIERTLEHMIKAYNSYVIWHDLIVTNDTFRVQIANDHSQVVMTVSDRR